MRVKRKITITLQKMFLLFIAWNMVFLWGRQCLTLCRMLSRLKIHSLCRARVNSLCILMPLS